MRLILTRHGETIENTEGILQGHLPGRLSEKGEEQARKLATRLKNEKIDCIYSSDLARASDTAREIAKYHSCPVHFIKELREQNLGSLSGKKEKDVDYRNNKDGESLRELIMRAEKLLEVVKKKHQDSIILFIGHSGINRALIVNIMKKNPEEFHNLKQHNTAMNIFEIKEEGNEIILFNCNKHLE